MTCTSPPRTTAALVALLANATTPAVMTRVKTLAVAAMEAGEGAVAMEAVEMISSPVTPSCCPTACSPTLPA